MRRAACSQDPLPLCCGLTQSSIPKGGQARTFHQHHISCRGKEKLLTSVLLDEKLKPSITEEQYCVFQNTRFPLTKWQFTTTGNIPFWIPQWRLVSPSWGHQGPQLSETLKIAQNINGNKPKWQIFTEIKYSLKQRKPKPGKCSTSFLRMRNSF